MPTWNAHGRADSPQDSGSGRAAPAWALDYETWARGSAAYAGVDSELRMRLTTLFFFLNRPTVAALMAVGSAMAAAVKNPDPSPEPSPGQEDGARAAPGKAGPAGDGSSAATASGPGLAEAAEDGGDVGQDASTASPSEVGDAGVPACLGYSTLTLPQTHLVVL